jgi:hypothetical protein
MLANQEKANLVMGAIFANLLTAWPSPIHLTPQKILQPILETTTRDDVRVFASLVKWLSDEGYLRIGSATLDGSYSNVVLSERGLRTLNSIPSGISSSKSYGEKIAEAAKEVTTDTAKKTIADLVGQMIGGVIKSLSAG